MKREGWADYPFFFHDSEELGPSLLAKVSKKTGLQPHDLQIRKRIPHRDQIRQIAESAGASRTSCFDRPRDHFCLRTVISKNLWAAPVPIVASPVSTQSPLSFSFMANAICAGPAL